MCQQTKHLRDKELAHLRLKAKNNLFLKASHRAKDMLKPKFDVAKKNPLLIEEQRIGKINDRLLMKNHNWYQAQPFTV